MWALFDFIRHGLAHQYQQIIVCLKDKKQFYISFPIGADYGRNLYVMRRPKDHLGYKVDSDGDLRLKVYPDTLYLDIKKTVEACNLLKQGLSFRYLARPKGSHLSGYSKSPRISFYDFDLSLLELSLKTENHPNI